MGNASGARSTQALPPSTRSAANGAAKILTAGSCANAQSVRAWSNPRSLFLICLINKYSVMKKKVQISTVELKALSEVIVLDTQFVAKAVRAADVAKEAKRILDEDAPVTEVLNEYGAPVPSPDGEHPVMETDWQEWGRRGYNGLPVREMFDKLIPFAIELGNALLGEE